METPRSRGVFHLRARRVAMAAQAANHVLYPAQQRL